MIGGSHEPVALRAVKNRLDDLVDEARVRLGDDEVTEMLNLQRIRIMLTRQPRIGVIDVRPFWGGRPRRLVPVNSPEEVAVGDWLNWLRSFERFRRVVFQVLAIEPAAETGAPVALCSVEGRNIDTWAPVEWPAWSPSCKVNLQLPTLRKLERRP